MENQQQYPQSDDMEQKKLGLEADGNEDLNDIETDDDDRPVFMD